jgi:hypothetical protein
MLLQLLPNNVIYINSIYYVPLPRNSQLAYSNYDK